MSELGPTEITVDGAYEMLTFKKGQMTDQEFIDQVQVTKVPWIEMQAPGWIAFAITTEFAKDKLLSENFRILYLTVSNRI